MTTFLNMEVSELPSTHKLCYLGDCNFTRASVAYDYAGNEVPANTPRFKHRVPDVTVRNLLTGNQSDGGDTLNPELLTLNQRTGTDALGDTTGFINYKGNEAISSSDEQAHTGTKSLKVVTNGYSTAEGVYLPSTTVTASTVYNMGFWINAPLSSTLQLLLTNSIGGTSLGSVNFTGTGTWQWVELTSNPTIDTGLRAYILTKSTAQDITFYVDDLRLAKNDTTGRTAEIGTETLTITGEESHQGYRSCEVVTAATANSGFKTTATTATPGTIYTKQVRVKATNGKTMKLAMRNNDGTSIATTSFTATGGWDLITVTGTPKAEATGIICAVTNDSAEEVTFKTDTAMLETGSTAHDWAYGGSSYSTYKTEQGCLVEEAHTNLLTANQSTGTDTLGDTTGFNVYLTTSTISSSTEQALQGTKSLKIITKGETTPEGIKHEQTVTNGVTYTFSAWVYAPLGAILRIQLESTYTVFTGTGAWQNVSVTHTQSDTLASLYITTHGNTQAITFYVDMLQLTATAYPLSWTLGGTTMAAETLTAPSSVLNIDEDGYSNLLTPNQADGTDTSGTVTEFIAYKGDEIISSSTEQAHQGTRSIKVVTDGSHANEGMYFERASLPSGITYHGGAWVYAPNGQTMTMLLYVTGSGGVTTVSFVGTGDWQYVGGVITPTNANGVRFYFYTSGTAQAVTFYVDEVQLSATSTARTWIPGGTQVNSGAGTIELEAYLSHIPTSEKTAFGFKGGPSGNQSREYISVTSTQFKHITCSNSACTFLTLSKVPVLGLNKITARFGDNNVSELDVNGVNGSASGANLMNQNSDTHLFFGSEYTGLNQLNAIIRNIVISKTKRTDEDVTARAESELPVADEHCTMIYPLVKDLSAYKVVAK